LKRHVLPLLLLLLVTAISLRAACDFRPALSEPYRHTALDLAIDGDHLWVATSYGVALYDIRNGEPEPVTSLALDGATSTLLAAGGVVFAGSGSTLHVLRGGARIETVGAVTLPGEISDFAHVPPYLFAATSVGVVQVDVFFPERPAVGVKLATSSGRAISLARLDSTLYAADGDATVEAYSVSVPSFPQQVGAVPTIARASSIHAAGTKLLVSDGQQTAIHAGTGAALTRIGTLPWGGLAAAPLGTDAAFMAGTSRDLRAVDYSVPSLASVLFEFDLLPTGGTVNRFGALALAGGRLYAAAGDGGLLTFDVSRFTAWPLRSFAFGGTGSVATGGGTAWFGDRDAGLVRASISGGTIAVQGRWDAARRSVVHDVEGNSLLTSAGETLTLWNVGGSEPSVAASAQIASGIRSAVLLGNLAVVAAGDATLWSVSFAGASPTVAPLPGRGSFLAKNGAAVVVAEITSAGSTNLRWSSSGNVGSPSASVTIEGAATSGVALDGNGRAVAATFRGLHLIDFGATPAVALFEGTEGIQFRAVGIGDGMLFAARGEAVEVWSASLRSRVATVDLPAEPLAISRPAAGRIVVPTTAGAATLAWDGTAALPSLLASGWENDYYSRIVAAEGVVYLFGPRRLAAYTVDGARLRGLTRVKVDDEIVGIATTGRLLYAFTADGRISVRDAALRPLGSIQAVDAAELMPVAIHAVNGALWLSVAPDCRVGACERQTIVFRLAGGIAPVATLTGGIADVALTGTTARVLTELPSELRVVDVTNPHAPVVVRSVAAAGNLVSVAHLAGRGKSWIVGNVLEVWDENFFAPSGTMLSPYVNDPAGRVSWLDQRVRLSGDCAVVIGRSFSPILMQVGSGGDATVLPSRGTPAAVRSIAIEGENVFLLTDYSVEMWTTVDPASRRRAVRR
jgi:hypothetical protein